MSDIRGIFFNWLTVLFRSQKVSECLTQPARRPLMPLGVDPNLAMLASNKNPYINVTTYKFLPRPKFFPL